MQHDKGNEMRVLQVAGIMITVAVETPSARLQCNLFVHYWHG